MTAAEEIDQLIDKEVRFSIQIGGKGYVVQVGDYAHQTTPSIESGSLEDALRWLRAYIVEAPVVPVDTGPCGTRVESLASGTSRGTMQTAVSMSADGVRDR